MRLQRRQRASEISGLSLDSSATQTLLRSIERVRGEGEVWEPYMTMPADSTEAAEREAVAAAVSRLTGRLALDDPTGVGVLRNAHL